MLREELNFSYPEELVATHPQKPSRVLWFDGEPREITLAEMLAEIPEGDLLIVNETKVLKRRVFAGEKEILFLKNLEGNLWQVLFPSRDYKVGAQIELPEGVSMKLVQKGRPQIVETSRALDSAYFEKHGEVPLPPYIQKARGQRHAVGNDDSWYQTFWATQPGSLAAPTASLHFTKEQFDALKARGVRILPVTLHVGLGTFLPVTSEDLKDHEMHFEEVEIPAATWSAIQKAKAEGRHVWALGTTVARSLESAAAGKLAPQPSLDQKIGFRGETNLFILPGFQWKIVDRLLTNFHQPESTLLALVASFARLDNVKTAYQWAIDKKFRLFSYGDLSVWIK